MLFNSIEFAIFFPIVFFIYWFVNKRGLRLQNFLLLFASYYFYACWDWRFLFLLMFSTLLDYFTGMQMCKSDTRRQRQFWFWLSVVINLGFLGVFKYYNFFAESFSDFLSVLGFTVHPTTIKVILPVGISFYTFHGLSYVIDIYFGKIKAERNFVDYALFVSFFPLLVAGPIERATHLLPQIKQKREFDYSMAVDGLKQMLVGFFKKMVIADNCAIVVNQIFGSYETQTASTLVLGAVLFAFQIYGDFSGYSDIAIGCARLLGINLLKNFNYPYFSRDIAEFWRRWHISLTTWFRDYIYIPLGGSREGKFISIRNTFAIFLISGFWHGANWTFIVWGLYHAVLFLPLLIAGKNRKNTNVVAQGRILPSLKEFFSMLLTFTLVTIGWIIFRAENIHVAFDYIAKIFSPSIVSAPLFTVNVLYALFSITILLLMEWIGREQNFALEITFKNKVMRWSYYMILMLIIIELGGSQQTFIYFQF